MKTHFRNLTASLALIFLFVNLHAQTKPRIFINEFLASNLTDYPDMVDFGDFSDWIELYNDENTELNIGGYYLSDDFSQPKKWQFPSNTIIPAKGFYLVWADDFNDVPGKNYTRDWWPDNIRYTTQWCHTNFKLNKGGDGIGLYDQAGNKIDSISFSSQITDVSYGRQPDGSSNWFYFGEPTPLNSNSTSGITTTETSGDADFSIEGGFYQGSVQISLSSSSGSGTIHYTTDGSKPSSSSQQYVSSITISKTTVLRARIFEESKLPGIVTTNTYFINETRNLPAVSLTADPTFLWNKQLGIYINTYKDRQIPVSLEYFPLNSGRSFFIDAGARIGGENIYRFAQKPINIYTNSDYGYSHFSYKIFDDLPFLEYKRLYLRNSGDDWPNTMFVDGLMVNILKGRISNSMQDFKPAVLYLNGQYWGINNLREKIDEQYFLLHYDVHPDNLDHLESDNTVISGDSTDFVNLLTYASRTDLSDPSYYDYVASRIDIHNLMDFVIAQDYLANSSWGHNREVWRDNKNEKLWRWILVDMDRGFNTSRISDDRIDEIYNDFELFRDLCANKNFKDEFVQRYAEHLNHTFNVDRVDDKIDSLKALIENEMPRHIQKWGTYIDSLTIDIWGQTPGVTSLTYWNSEVQKLKNFAAQRTNYAVQYLRNRFNLEDRAHLKISSNLQNTGKLTINNIYENWNEDNLFFMNVPLNVQAFPPPGYNFKQWKQISTAENVNLIQAGSVWKYRDEGSAPDNSWKNTDYNDSGWKSGNAQLGYGDGDENTVIGYGNDSNNKYITSYYRQSFQITNPANVKELKLSLLRDDGAIVYLNGSEVVRSNMPTGTVTYSTYAPTAVGGTDESTFFEFTIDNSKLVAGKNVIAVEIHQANGSSSDISFDLSLSATLNQQSAVENVVGTGQSITVTMNGDTELIAEFEKISSSEVAQVISNSVTLSKSNSPYFVVDNVTVEQNGTLTVEPGTIIYFSAGKGLYVKGKLLMEGTETEPITLTSYYANEKWGAISFDNSTGNSELNYVNISNATNGPDEVNYFAAVSSYYSTVQLNNVHFSHVKLPVSSQWSDMTINSCKFENVTEVGDFVNCNGGNIRILNSIFNGNDINDMDGIDLGFNTGITEIKNNTIRDFTGSNSDGIDLGDASTNVIVEGNIILNCSDKGVSIGQGSTAVLSHNAVAGCHLGVGIKDSLSYANIINCTFYSNNIGVDCFEKTAGRGGGSADVRNSVFADSKESSFTIDNLSKINIAYSLSNTEALPGEENIFDEPLLINPKGANFHIQTNSPCIDNGDPQTQNDYDGTRNDIGAFEYAGMSTPVVVINEINYNSDKNFDTEDWIELYNNTNQTIDLVGWVFMDENRTPSYVFDSATYLQPNSYLVVCRDIILFKSGYPGVINYFGDMSSGLSGGGEIIFLYDNNGLLVDSLTYDDKDPWPLDADGGGSSLELTNPKLDNSVGSNWKASIGHGTPGAKNSTYIVGVDENTNKIIPSEFSLKQNYPNPFNPSTIISYDLPENGLVTLKIFDVLGREVATLVDEYKQAGTYHITFNTSHFSLPSGIYFYRLRANSFIATKKLLLVK